MAVVTDSKARENSVHPSISFTVQIDYLFNRQVIVGVEGWLSTKSGVILSRTYERTGKTDQELAGQGTALDGNFQHLKHSVELIADLDPLSLRRIDDERMADPKRDVHLKLELSVKRMESRVNIANLYDVDMASVMGRAVEVDTSTGRRKATLTASAFDQRYTANKTNGWVLSGDNGPIFLKVSSSIEDATLRIPANDWIQDFAPKLGLGKYFIVETPETKASEECTVHLSKAEEAFRRWDTKGVFSNCREVGKVLDDQVKAKFGAASFTYKERWGRGFNHWASLDLHNADLGGKYPGEDVSAKRADSEALLLFTKVLVKFAQELMLEKVTS